MGVACPLLQRPLPLLTTFAVVLCYILGRRFAELEMHIVLAQMMRNFRLEYRDEEPMEFVNELLYCPARRMDLALVDVDDDHDRASHF